MDSRGACARATVGRRLCRHPRGHVRGRCRPTVLLAVRHGHTSVRPVWMHPCMYPLSPRVGSVAPAAGEWWRVGPEGAPRRGPERGVEGGARKGPVVACCSSTRSTEIRPIVDLGGRNWRPPRHHLSVMTGRRRERLARGGLKVGGGPRLQHKHREAAIRSPAPSAATPACLRGLAAFLAAAAGPSCDERQWRPYRRSARGEPPPARLTGAVGVWMGRACYFMKQHSAGGYA